MDERPGAEPDGDDSDYVDFKTIALRKVKELYCRKYASEYAPSSSETSLLQFLRYSMVLLST